MSTKVDEAKNVAAEQAALWNGTAGQAWVASQAILDEMFQPFEAVLAAAVPAAPGTSVLDIGCGNGATTLAIARLRPDGGACVGADISAPMVEVARARAAAEGSRAQFLVGDVQTQAFEAASFDAFVSRFGVMFFADPVQAFGNLRRAARPGARLRCIAWRSAAENPFMTTAERAAAPHVQLPPRPTSGPGQFAFADAAQVHRILDGSGWSDVALTPLDVPCTFPVGELEPYLSRLGPLGHFLHEADAETRQRVLGVVLGAFAPFLDGELVRFTAACWQIEARAQ